MWYVVSVLVMGARIRIGKIGIEQETDISNRLQNTRKSPQQRMYVHCTIRVRVSCPHIVESSINYKSWHTHIHDHKHIRSFSENGKSTRSNVFEFEFEMHAMESGNWYLWHFISSVCQHRAVAGFAFLWYTLRIPSRINGRHGHFQFRGYMCGRWTYTMADTRFGAKIHSFLMVMVATPPDRYRKIDHFIKMCE